MKYLCNLCDLVTIYGIGNEFVYLYKFMGSLSLVEWERKEKGLLLI